jgi:hypothetical protein
MLSISWAASSPSVIWRSPSPSVKHCPRSPASSPSVKVQLPVESSLASEGPVAGRELAGQRRGQAGVGDPPAGAGDRLAQATRVAAVGQQQGPRPGEVALDRRRDRLDRPARVAGVAGVVAGEVGRAAVILVAVAAVVEHQQIAGRAGGQVGGQPGLDLPGGGRAILEVDDLLGRYLLLLKELDQQLVAALALGKRVPHRLVLPLQRPDDKHPGALRLPVSLVGHGAVPSAMT